MLNTLHIPEELRTTGKQTSEKPLLCSSTLDEDALEVSIATITYILGLVVHVMIERMLGRNHQEMTGASQPATQVCHN